MRTAREKAETPQAESLHKSKFIGAFMGGQIKKKFSKGRSEEARRRRGDKPACFVGCEMRSGRVGGREKEKNFKAGAGSEPGRKSLQGFAAQKKNFPIFAQNFEMLSRIVAIYKKLRAIPTYHYIGVSALVALILLQMSNFMTAFRITSDDNEFYLAFLTTKWWELWKRGWDYAIPTGRIYHIYVYPFSAWATYLLNFKITQYVFLWIFVFYGLVPVFWLSRFAGKQIGLFASVSFFSLVPVGFNYWPPNSVGYLMFIYSGIYWTRLLFWYVKNKYLQGFITFLSILVVMGSEYNLVLFPLVLLVEYFEELGKIFSRQVLLRDFFQRKDVQRDLLILGIAWLGYLLFYLVFPTRYTGNQIRIFDWEKVFEIQWEHIYNGLSVAYTDLFQGKNFRELPWNIGLLTALASSYAFKFHFPRFKQWLIAGKWGLLVAFFSTFLIAITPKYQELYEKYRIAAYIDSRIALIGFLTFSACIFLFLARHFKPYVATLGILFLSVVSMSTYSHNQKIKENLELYNSPFQVAERYVCLTEEETRYDSLFSKGLAQDRLLGWHKDFTRYIPLFWIKHIETLRKLRNFSCLENSEYPLGRNISFAMSGTGKRFLMFGWSRPEQWGAWSDGDSALVLLKLGEKPRKDLLLTLSLSPYINKKIPEQQVIIRFFDIPLDTLKFTQRKRYIVKAKIPKEYFTDNFMPLLLKLPNAVSPKKTKGIVSGDHRKLGIMLLNLKLEENTIKNE